ncbi:GNAT family N-acetyltransferase [Lutibacter citreus]|uniref:GNAT family N-acetyltransferase n=1 Tax=Lutibacter citreus TaxID=2138210 RepID=UPI00130068B6|nr:GNAT family N-acetyltransferase [Lutibacter citreus]
MPLKNININIGDFAIVNLKQKDAISLSEMLLVNKVRFQRYFPKTLEENLNLEMTKLYIDTKNALLLSNKEYTLGIKDIKNEKIIGLVIIKNIDNNKKNAEVAYSIDSDYGNKGLMTKAVNEISKFAHKKVNLKSLFILAHKTNLASVKVAKKTGFVWKKTELKSYIPKNELVAIDMEMFVKEF